MTSLRTRAPQEHGPQLAWTSPHGTVWQPQECHIPVPGTFLIPKSLTQQLSLCGPQPCGQLPGQGNLHLHIEMSRAFSHSLSSAGGFMGAARVTSQQTEGKRKSLPFCSDKRYY